MTIPRVLRPIPSPVRRWAQPCSGRRLSPGRSWGCVQFMCARIGMVTGMGLGDALRRKGPRWLMFFGALALLAANTINVGADLSGMADAAEMLSGINSHVYVVIFGIAITYATVRFRYHQIAMIMKWLAAVLFGYVITAF